MILESLFARESQCRAFLYLALCGVILGAMVHAGGYARRCRRWAGIICDVLSACVLLGMLLGILLRYGGVRFYGLLGIVIGLVLYEAGVRQVVDAAVHGGGKVIKRMRKTSAPKAGIPPGNAESITINGEPRKE